MKTFLKIIALFSLVALSSAAAAETAGVNLPAYASAEAALSLFVIAVALLTFGHDYRQLARLDAGSRRPWIVLPAADAFASRRPPLPARPSRPRRTFKPAVTL